LCLNETCSEVCIDKNLSDAFPIQNGLKQGDSFALEYDIRKVQGNWEDWNWMEHMSSWSICTIKTQMLC